MTTNIVRSSRIVNQFHEPADEQLPCYELEPTDLPPSYESICSANSIENEYSENRDTEYTLNRNNEYVTADNSETNVWVNHFHSTEINTVSSSIVSTPVVTNLTTPTTFVSQSTGTSNTSFQSARTSVPDATVSENAIVSENVTPGIPNNFSHNSISQHPLANILQEDDSKAYDGLFYKKYVSDVTPFIYDDDFCDHAHDNPFYITSANYGTQFQDNFGFFDDKTGKGLKFGTTQFKASETDRITAFSSQAGISNIFLSSEKGEYLEKLTEIKNRDIVNKGSCTQDNFKVKNRKIVSIVIETSNTNKKDKNEISVTRLKFNFSDKTSEKFGAKKFKNVNKYTYLIVKGRKLSHISVCYGDYSIRGISFTTTRINNS
ncbi:hypothetical protein B5S28_g5247 [[Candida] boidinii]|nr:hypothetical protein B5S28_g5247 [[Candida] boidinii]OWB81093.1 hypothetical protein B5S32_g5446 [[Candida] boidinii]